MTTPIWPPNMVTYVRRQLPPIERVGASLDGGPTVTLPAIFVHLCLLRIEQLELEQRKTLLMASPAIAQVTDQSERGA